MNTDNPMNHNGMCGIITLWYEVECGRGGANYLILNGIGGSASVLAKVRGSTVAQFQGGQNKESAIDVLKLFTVDIH